MKLKLSISFFIWVICFQIAKTQTRQIIDFNYDWKFKLTTDSLAQLRLVSSPTQIMFDDSNWRTLNLPHDWSIESDFIKDAPATNLGGSLPGGIGWYRKTFVLPQNANDKLVSILFDGVYRNSEVWINEHYLGKRPNGYVNFEYDLTEFIKPFPQKNIIAVKVDNSQQPNSRWYTGSGIYRDVKLVIKNDFHLLDNKLQVATKSINKDTELLNVSGVFKTNHGHYLVLKIKYTLLDNTGKNILTKIEKVVTSNQYGGFKNEYKIDNSTLWNPDNPNLYKLKVELLSLRDDVLDEITTAIGFRTILFNAQKGFFLNNQPLKLKGVCLHHDLGALGAAFNKEAARRQLAILKEMGCNAIRFAHNPPANAMLDLCDEMGFLVIDEAFDMWNKKKTKFDYSKDFKDWYKKDLEAMVLRDRNHPSVIMWSIGNEIREQFDSSAINFTKELVQIVKQIDTTRPVISAMTETNFSKNFITQSKALDVLGFNYKDYDYEKLPTQFPNQKFVATETASALATRGVYNQPSDTNRIWPPNYKVQDNFTGGNTDFTCASYDNTYAYWGNTHERSWAAVKKNNFISGAFVWSGFDYLGEPTPYPFPARSSYFGIIDLAGFPKDVYYMYKSDWSAKNVLHVFPHWNHTIGDTIDVWAYYNNADEVELFLNNKSLGTRKKEGEALHVMWRVPYVPGTLKAISRMGKKTILSKEIKTAGEPYKIILEANKKLLKADGKDVVFITAKIVDKNGILCPNANNLIEFSINGSAFIAGTDNGYQADINSFKNKNRNAWKGLALAIVQNNTKKGNSTLIAKSTGLVLATIALKND